METNDTKNINYNKLVWIYKLHNLVEEAWQNKAKNTKKVKRKETPFFPSQEQEWW